MRVTCPGVAALPRAFELPYLAISASFLTLAGLGAAGAAELPPIEGRTNLAAGRPVVFAPAPNYRLTTRGESDSADLTDGRLTKRDDRHIWFDASAVGWSYGGRVNLAVDLGSKARIDEIAIRLLGGSPQPGINFPGWIEAFTSDDGLHYRKVAECSRWRDGDFARFGVPEDEGKAWIHCLRFEGLKAHGRWVGLRMYASGLSASDELYVFGATDDGQERPLDAGETSDFTVRHPQPYFHKPRLVLATNVPGPIPLGVVVPEGAGGPQPLEMTVELPAGVEFLAGQVAKKELAQFKCEAISGGGKRYAFQAACGESNKNWGWFYVQAPGWKDGQSGVLRYSFRSGDWQSPVIELPLEAVEIPSAPRLKRVMAGLGWWGAAATARWPGALDAWERLGLNTFPLFPGWMKEDDAAWLLIEEARRRGFFIACIASPLHRTAERGKRSPEVYHQLAKAPAKPQLCPAYRGPLYQAEIARFAQGIGRARPDFVSVDIEVWGWQGPIDAPRCSRCQEDFKASGLASWDEWYMAKGDQMWRDLIGAARAEAAKQGGPKFEIGGYDFRPGGPYQKVWSVDRCYPDWMQSSQVSTYSCLYPYHLELIGNEARLDRSRLTHSDVLPWLTPGDAGTFPAESFQWALLECFANGARGVWFWSSRVWDMESLVAYNRVVRAIAPVEEIIVQGHLVGDAAAVEGPGRVSGMVHGPQMVLLAADYFGRSGGRLRVRLKLPQRSQIRDLLSGKPVAGPLAAGDSVVELPLEGAAARLLHVLPAR